MCRVYNTIGCLNTIQHHLVKNNLDEFNSLGDILNFLKEYYVHEQKIIVENTLLIQKEKETLEKEISELITIINTKKQTLNQDLEDRLQYLYQQIENLPASNNKILPFLIYHYKNTLIWLKIWTSKPIFQFKKVFSNYPSKVVYKKKNKRFSFIETHFQEAVNRNSLPELKQLQRKKRIIQVVNNTLYGALGEHKVENVLKSLPDDCILINDFSYTFSRALYLSKSNEYVSSVQIDHLLITPAGIFIIETKNWSENTIEKGHFFSPVKQIKRANYGIYRILSEEMNRLLWSFSKHHWGKRKIPIRNIIVFVNHKPIEEFEHVKILELGELKNYIQYFKPSFQHHEVENIAQFLLHKSNQKRVVSQLTMI